MSKSRTILNLIGIWFMLILSVPGLAQLTNAEYYWDIDPGEGLGTPLIAADGSYDSAIEQVLLEGINQSPGAHVFGVRFRDATSWGPTFTHVIQQEELHTPELHLITQAEYYWDSDPGEGSGIPLIAFDGAFDTSIEQAILRGVSQTPGPHVFGIRFKDVSGWGPAFTHVIQQEELLTPELHLITQAEYYWDSDPGEGAGIPLIAFDGAFDASIEQAMLGGVSHTPGPHVFGIRFKDAASWGPAFTHVIQQEELLTPELHLITQAEYYWDSDPGEGSGIPLIAFDGAFDASIEQAILGGVSQTSGPHVFGIRFKDVSGWGPVFTHVIQQESSLTLVLPELTQAEYYWDSDPGEGAGIPLIAFDEPFDSAIEQVLLNGVSQSSGPHVFGVRFKDAAGWGPAFTHVIQQEELLIPELHLITQAEYYWNSDPGEGSGTPLIAFDGAFDSVIEQVILDGVSQTTGAHSFGVRFRDNNGWGHTFTKTFHFEENIEGFPAHQIVQSEYYWDIDPGEGLATPMITVDGVFDEIAEEFEIEVTHSLTTGLHSFNVRTKGKDGVWGDVHTSVILVEEYEPANTANQLVSAEYFWDTDPGVGNGIPVESEDGIYDGEIEMLSVSISELPAPGTHTFNIRGLDKSGNWGEVNQSVVSIEEYVEATTSHEVVEAEFFWNVDPGEGLGVPFIASDGSFDEEVETLFSGATELPTQGLHTFNIRTKGKNGTWGIPYTVVISVEDERPPMLPHKITNTEYFWDSDPGEGNGISFAAEDGSFDEMIESILTNELHSLSPGLHTFNVRAKDEDTWGELYTTLVLVDDVLPLAQTNSENAVLVIQEDSLSNSSKSGYPKLIDEGQALSLYPNPASEVVTIKMIVGDEQVLRVIDLNGKVLFMKSFETPVATFELDLGFVHGKEVLLIEQSADGRRTWRRLIVAD